MCHQVTLTILQQAVYKLTEWAGKTLEHQYPEDTEAIAFAKNTLGWGEEADIKPLRLLFDQVKLEKKDTKEERKNHYFPAQAIANNYPSIPYPSSDEPSLEEIKQEIISKLELTKEDLENLSFLLLILEKYGSYLSLSQSESDQDISLFDLVRSVAAIAESLAHYPIVIFAFPLLIQKGLHRLALLLQLNLILIAGDLSGIQDFIYTISSDGALKSLRARSFYLGLIAEEIVTRILEDLKLPRTNIIYAGGGNLYLLAPDNENTYTAIAEIRQDFNKWLRGKFQNKIFLALDCHQFPVSHLESKEKESKDCNDDKSFVGDWDKAIKKLSQQKNKKFIDQLDLILKVKNSFSQKCQICHRDDTENLKPLNPKENDSALACPNCREMFKLGSDLLNAEGILRSKKSIKNLEIKINSFSKQVEIFAFILLNKSNFKRLALLLIEDYQIRLSIGSKTTFYYLFKSDNQLKIDKSEQLFLINNWDLRKYRGCGSSCFSMVLGNYAKEGAEGIMRAGELAAKAKGINRVGYLRMDVDNLGRIFSEGLKDVYNLPRLASLSRHLSYFFTVYLTSLAEDRKQNCIEPCIILDKNNLDQDSSKEVLIFAISLLIKSGLHRLGSILLQVYLKTKSNLVFIYAGGDDLFVSGSWNEVVEFAFDVYQAFRAYTGNNPDITLSGGICLGDVKFPLYQAARESGDAEDKAKGNDRDSLGLFGEVFKWGEWLGGEDKDINDILKYFDQKTQEYLSKDATIKLDLFGVLPFVKILQSKEIGYSRGFIRNLLNTANLQEQKIKEIENKQKEEKYCHQKKDIKYYLYLPNIAYTLARLPQQIQKNNQFKKVSSSLKIPYNAPYFRAIATWIELLNRQSSED